MTETQWLTASRVESAVGAAVAQAVVEQERYRSSFANWDRRAAVRVKPSRGPVAEETGKLWFPPELAPHVTHPLVTGRGDDDLIRRLLVQRLYQYLDFTTELESVAVLPVAGALGRGRAGFALPPPMRADAFKIATDEAWHAQFSDALLRDVENATGVPQHPTGEPLFIDRLRAVRRGAAPYPAAAGRVLFAVVSETLISSILSEIPRDRRLHPTVRAVIADHAEDEGRHHAYFRDLLAHFWPSLPAADRSTLGVLLPDLVSAFLTPDYRAICRVLLAEGFTAEDAERVIVDSYPAEALRTQIIRAARPTLRYFGNAGIFDLPSPAAVLSEFGP
jgi:P-aminobenzoate N-oxygenase AurF